MYSKIKGKFMVVSDRDFCYAGKIFESADNTILIFTSIEHPSCPVNDGVVRGSLHLSGWFLTKKSETETNLTTVLCSDPNGSVP